MADSEKATAAKAEPEAKDEPEAKKPKNAKLVEQATALLRPTGLGFSQGDDDYNRGVQAVIDLLSQ